MVPPEEESKGSHVLVGILALAVLLGVVTVAEAHGGPDLVALVVPYREREGDISWLGVDQETDEVEEEEGSEGWRSLHQAGSHLSVHQMELAGRATGKPTHRGQS